MRAHHFTQSRFGSLRFVVSAALLISVATAPRLGAQGRPEFVPGELLVGLKFQDSLAITSAVSTLASDPSVAAVVSKIPQIGVIRIRVKDGLDLEEAANRLRTRADVAYVEKNSLNRITATPNDQYYYQQYAPAAVEADKAWEIWKPRKRVIVAIVDTGVDYNHPDLRNKILLDSNNYIIGYNSTGVNEISGNPSDPIDVEGHGTHVAGIIGAQANNSTGVAGIAGWNGNPFSTDTDDVKLMPIKAGDSSGSFIRSDEADGIIWAADHGAQVINLSLGVDSSALTEQNAINYALDHGCVVVAAAGNSGVPTLTYPGAYPGVISVAATDQTNTLTDFSNYGSWVACAAPGKTILSTLPTYTTPTGITDYGYESGTSMATPLVVGEAALLLAQNPNLTRQQISRYILTNVDSYNSYAGRTIGGGRVNVNKALRAITYGGYILDFNRDGHSDVLYMNKTTHQMAVLLLSGASVISSYSLTPTLSAEWQVGATGDFFGNGSPGIVVQKLSTQQISVLGVTGHTITTSTPLKPSLLPGWEVRCSADIDGDGSPDLIAQNTTTGAISVLIVKNLKITASMPVKPNVQAGWKLVGARDFNGDGHPDLLVHQPSTGRTSILVLSGANIVSSVPCSPYLALGWTVTGVSDMNWNGSPEVIARQNSTGKVLILVLTGTKYTSSFTFSPTPPLEWDLVAPK